MQSKKFWLVRFYIIFLIISFFGWTFETVQVSILADKLVDRGYLTLPICPIYGLTIVFIYFIAGMPHKTRGLLKKVEKPIYCYLLYFLISFLVPTVFEFVVGIFFHKVFGVMLWDYSHLPLNIGGYVCLGVSFCWAVAITFLMRITFPVILRFVLNIPGSVANVLAISIGSVMFFDILFNFWKSFS